MWCLYSLVLAFSLKLFSNNSNNLIYFIIVFILTPFVESFLEQNSGIFTILKLYLDMQQV